MQNHAKTIAAPVWLGVMVLMAFIATSCSMAGGDVFAGRWQGAYSECVISKDANSYLVSRKNPGGIMNDTVPAALRDGKLEMSQTLYGVIVHSKNEAVIYFVGGNYKRVKP